MELLKNVQNVSCTTGEPDLQFDKHHPYGAVKQQRRNSNLDLSPRFEDQLVHARIIIL